MLLSTRRNSNISGCNSKTSSSWKWFFGAFQIFLDITWWFIVTNQPNQITEVSFFNFPAVLLLVVVVVVVIVSTNFPFTSAVGCTTLCAPWMVKHGPRRTWIDLRVTGAAREFEAQQNGRTRMDGWWMIYGKGCFIEWDDLFLMMIYWMMMNDELLWFIDDGLLMMILKKKMKKRQNKHKQ